MFSQILKIENFNILVSKIPILEKFKAFIEGT